MKLTKASFSAAINLGNYESKRIELQYELNEDNELDKARDAAFSFFKKEAQKGAVGDSYFLK